MPIEISSLTQLNPEKVQAMVATLSQLMAERHPEVELTRGVFHDLVLYFDGLLNAAIQENIDRVQQSKSLLKITENPELADADLVDQVLSNFNLTRDNGTPATGALTIIFNSDTRTEISSAVRFAAEDAGVVFVPTNSFVVFSAASADKATETNQRKMIPVGDGTFAATITVIALSVGSAGNIKRGVNLTPNSVINNVAAAYAATDFIEGSDAATNSQYLQRLASGLAAKTIGSRQSYEAALTTQSAFSNIKNLSILGCGDAEQQRDQHTLFPVSGGGKIDIYAQTNMYAQEKEHMLTATYVEPYLPPTNSSGDCAERALVGGTTTGTVWQVSINREAAPGFYEVVSVVDPTVAQPVNYSVLLDTRHVDFSELDFVPDIMYIPESAYTRYQTAVIRFVNTDIQPNPTLVAGQTKKLYGVTTVGMPLIAELQDYLTGRETRPRATDILVKAPVPCFTKISFEIRKPAAEAAPNLEAIKKSISTAIGAIGFSGQLHASVITNVVHRYLSGRQAVGSVDMFGRIRRPDGTTARIRDNTILQIPDDVARLVTGRTTAFLTRPEDISISVVSGGWAS
jgi:hypothetical protein